MLYWPGERLFAASTDADQQSITALLTDHTSDSWHMLHRIQEKHQLHLFTGRHVEVIQILQYHNKASWKKINKKTMLLKKLISLVSLEVYEKIN